jgi:hypothetical protein
MIQPSSSHRLIWGAAGLTNAFLYTTSRRRFLGFTLAGWFKFLSLVLVLAAWLLRWPTIWLLVALGLAFGLRLLYWRAKRKGFITFVPVPKQQIRSDARPLADNHKVAVRATGLFSVSDREAYLLQHLAEYWRVPVGDHAIMVQQVPGRFLYQFVQSGALRHVEPGLLVYGRQPERALAVTFLTTWGPKSPERLTLYNVNSSNHTQERLEQQVFLTFDNDDDLHSVWNNLLRDRAPVR